MGNEVKKNLFVINPVSFFTDKDLDFFIRLVRSYFVGREDRLDVRVSAYPRDAVTYTRNYVENLDPETRVRIYAVGGDGILFDCLNGIVGLPNVELGVIPHGKTNDFVRSFGEGLNAEFRDIGLQLSGKSLESDAISVGGYHALNSCTVGMESYAAYKAVNVQKRFKPFLDNFSRPVSRPLYAFLYYVGGIFSIANKSVINQYYRLSVDGTDFSGNYASINIANGPCYGGDKCGAVAAMPDDGLLDVVLFKSTGVFDFLSKGFDYLYGRFHKYPELFGYHRAREVTIQSELPLILQLDGETIIDTGVTAKIVPKAVRIISVNDLKFKPRAFLEDIRKRKA
ncbi:MAG: hypothetical protein LBF41_10535 [Deltaproteobacteria bacterium]|jgi:diacylglycerol kinase family enzyme|nr:hypothetical protein [Deltaproteobacteria bacterium]